MFEVMELVLEFLPELVSIGNATQATRDGDAAFDRRLAVLAQATMAQHRHRLQLRNADRERGMTA